MKLGLSPDDTYLTCSPIPDTHLSPYSFSTPFPLPIGLIPLGLPFLVGNVISPNTSIPFIIYLEGDPGEGGTEDRIRRENSVS
jgi:hypothetical protein